MSESSPGPSLPSRFPATLEKCERQAASAVNSKLESLFGNAGQAFTEFAEKAQSDQIQAGFFSARGSLVANRGEIQRVFDRCFRGAFGTLRIPLFQSSTPSSEPADQRNEWSLVENSELDEMVVTQNLIGKASDRYFSELYALRQRLSLINRGQPLDERQVPTGPHHLVHCFRQAIAGLELEGKARVILYALFDRCVLQDLKPLYDGFNDTLIADGILPNLKHMLNPSRPQSRAGGTAPARARREEVRRQGQTLKEAGSDAPPTGLGDQLFASVLQLMGSRRAGAAGATGSAAAADVRDHGGGEPRAVHATLVAAVGDIQASLESPYRDAFSDREAAAGLQADPLFVENARMDLSAEREQIFKELDPEQMARIDADTIDVIGLLFEYMLNDAALPNVAKALISRLHTPYLKAALIERSLLDDAGHAARQLLDLMVEAGGYYVDESDPNWGIFPALRDTVDRILAGFTDNIELFRSLLEDLRAKVALVKRKIVTLEQRSRQAAEGRERFQVAKQKVAEAVEQRMRQPWVLQEVEAFLNKAWSDKLVFVLLRDPDGEEGEEWEQTLRVADELVALCDPRSWALQRKDVEAGLRGLHDEIELALDTLGARKPADWRPLAALLTNPKTLFDRVTASQTKPEPSATAAPAADREPRGRSAARSSSGPQNQQLVDQLRALEFGTWFEFTAKDGASHRRLKLSWHSPITETCMFVDRAGVKAEAFTMSELAAELAAGRATILAEPQQHFVERALHAILQMLRAPHAPRQA